MSELKTWRFYDQLPESFYDALAYVLPASLFCLALEHLFGLSRIFSSLFGESDTSLAKGIVVGFFLFGLFYVVGQFTTSLSYITLAEIVIRVRRRRNKNERKSKYFIMDRWFAIRANAEPGTVAEISKRLARWILGRNVAFLSLVLVIIAGFSENWTTMGICGGLVVIGIVDFWIRTSWIISSMEIVLKLVGVTDDDLKELAEVQ
ncbi:MAG: hypothetical protein GY835_16945 [bacterium]|nr:hypothetical protein [bacterium]